MTSGEEHDEDPTRPRADPNDPHSPPAGAADPVTQRAADGVKLWEQLKQIEPRERALYALSEMDEDGLRAMMTYHLCAWHQALDKRAADEYWREQERGRDD